MQPYIDPTQLWQGVNYKDMECIEILRAFIEVNPVVWLFKLNLFISIVKWLKKKKRNLVNLSNFDFEQGVHGSYDLPRRDESFSVWKWQQFKKVKNS